MKQLHSLEDFLCFLTAGSVCKLVKSLLLIMALFIIISLAVKVSWSWFWRINISLVCLLTHFVNISTFEHCDDPVVGEAFLCSSWSSCHDQTGAQGLIQARGWPLCLESISLEQWQGWRQPNIEGRFQACIREPILVLALSPASHKSWPSTSSPWASVSRLKLKWGE